MHFKTALKMNALFLAYITTRTTSKEHISKLHFGQYYSVYRETERQLFPKTSLNDRWQNSPSEGSFGRPKLINE